MHTLPVNSPASASSSKPSRRTLTAYTTRVLAAITMATVNGIFTAAAVHVNLAYFLSFQFTFTPASMYTHTMLLSIMSGLVALGMSLIFASFKSTPAVYKKQFGILNVSIAFLVLGYFIFPLFATPGGAGLLYM